MRSLRRRNNRTLGIVAVVLFAGFAALTGAAAGVLHVRACYFFVTSQFWKPGGK
jgi:hypothetical protein